MKSCNKFLVTLQKFHLRIMLTWQEKLCQHLAIEEVIAPCSALLGTLIWCDKHNQSLEEDGFYDDLEKAKGNRDAILAELEKIDQDPVRA